MKNAFGIVLIFSGLYMCCLSLPTELIENKVNCTKIGIASDCCETHGCVFLNCTDALKCEDAYTTSLWSDTCETAVNQCLEVLGNGTTLYPEYNVTTIIPLTSSFDNGTNSTSIPGTIPPTTSDSNNTYNESTTELTSTVNTTTTTTTAITSATAATIQLANSTADGPPFQQDAGICKRHFDTASFIGGMVFMFGLVAIGGFIYVYCRSQGNANYRLL